VTLGLVIGKRDNMIIVGWLADVASPARRESIRTDECDGLGELRADSSSLGPL